MEERMEAHRDFGRHRRRCRCRALGHVAGEARGGPDRCQVNGRGCKGVGDLGDPRRDPEPGGHQRP
eukprot:3763162-Prymnesium_polylepis.1